MRRVPTSLLLGASGFVGRWLAPYLASKGERVVGTHHRHHPDFGRDGKVRMVAWNAARPQGLDRLIRQFRPKHIYFLAAQSSVREAWENPEDTVRINMLGGIHLLEALRRSKVQAKILIFSSGTAYGLSHGKGKRLDEETYLRPKDPYSVSKVGMECFARLYAGVYGMPVVIVRLANLIGPGQSRTFSLANFACQIAAIEKGRQRPVISVGNLQASRDYLDVRDAVRAIDLLMRRGKKGDIYNLCSGRSRPLGSVLKDMIKLCRVPGHAITVRKSVSLMSKDEIVSVHLDGSKLREVTGWEPKIPFDETLEDILEDWRERVA